CCIRTKNFRTINSTCRSSARSGNWNYDCRLSCGFRIASITTAAIAVVSLIGMLKATSPPTNGCGVTPVLEQYGLGHSRSGDTPLLWEVFVPNDTETHPAIIVIHGGNFSSGDFNGHDTQTDQDLVCAGFCVFDIEYRLAPPGKIPGQGRDPGRYP